MDKLFPFLLQIVGLEIEMRSGDQTQSTKRKTMQRYKRLTPRRCCVGVGVNAYLSTKIKPTL